MATQPFFIKVRCPWTASLYQIWSSTNFSANFEPSACNIIQLEWSSHIHTQKIIFCKNANIYFAPMCKQNIYLLERKHFYPMQIFTLKLDFRVLCQPTIKYLLGRMRCFFFTVQWYGQCCKSWFEIRKAPSKMELFFHALTNKVLSAECICQYRLLFSLRHEISIHVM